MIYRDPSTKRCLETYLPESDDKIRIEIAKLLNNAKYYGVYGKKTEDALKNILIKKSMLNETPKNTLIKY